jgi:RNA polymerase sigma factor (sigma-70 family)
MTPRERSRRALERTLRGRKAASDERNLSTAEGARIEHALRRLSPPERSVLIAIRFEDRSYAEIAEQLGLSEPQVEELFARALSVFLPNLDQPLRHWWRCR